MSHSYNCLFFHVVWSTKKRLPLVAPDFKDKLYKFMELTVDKEGGHLIAIGGTHDHVHLLIKASTSCLVSKLVRQIKVHSTKFVNQHCKSPHCFAWQEGYSIFSVSNSHVKKITKYINRQF
jgi:putative transposase